MQIKCPKCHWNPRKTSLWTCEQCSNEFNIFETIARCPRCDTEHQEIYCIDWEGGCGELSPYLDWYTGLDNELLKLNVKKLID